MLPSNVFLTCVSLQLIHKSVCVYTTQGYQFITLLPPLRGNIDLVYFIWIYLKEEDCN